ncbi:MAG: sigma 54-interacting transcriptional regulator [Labilithrix sp.]|nr:sigma 54-interacting transcriptional regulator [Labilithrix sp.]
MTNPFDDHAGTVRKAGVFDAAPAFCIEIAGVSTPASRLVIEPERPGPALVGQSPACDLRLADPEVSRRHLEAFVHGGKLVVRDLQSTNGTFVDGIEIVEARLAGGEEVRLGSTTLRVKRVQPASTSSADAADDHFGKLMGRSPEMRRLYPLMARLAHGAIPVVIEGETGTGKEVLAEALHDASPRRDGPYVVFDCTATPPNLLEAELFGHERGAFTNALTMRKGVFEQAHGGTLLIDEIGDLDVALQSKLLRAIERGEVRRIGGDRWIKVDVFVLAATRRNLDREVQAGRFRDDLFHRLSVGRIELPPLRRRQGDVAFLASHFWHALGGAGDVPAGVLARWVDDAWPGNARALRNAVARQLALGDLAPLSASASPLAPSATPSGDFIDGVVAQRLPLPIARLKTSEELERRYTITLLAEHGGNAARAAEAAGIGRRYFDMIRRRVTTPAK